MDRPLRTLQPAGPVDRPLVLPPAPPSQVGKRKHTNVACNSCRRRKSKCDGQRPTCHACRSKNLECVYDSTRRKSTDVQARVNELEFRESLNLDFIDHWRRCPSPEAERYLRRLRAGEDYYSIVEEVVGADSLSGPTDDLDLSQVGGSVGGSSAQTPRASIQSGSVSEQRGMMLSSLPSSGMDEFPTTPSESGLPWLQANTGMAQFETLDEAQYSTYPFEMPSITGQGAGVDILADTARQIHEQQQGEDSPERQ